MLPASLQHSTGTLEARPTKTLWQTSTEYRFYTGDQGQNAGSYYILKWPLVDPTYGTIGDYVQNGNYDHFFMQEGLNREFVYIVKKLGSNFNPHGSSYYGVGFLRMKHHIVNGYLLYLLGQPWSKVYTCTVNSGWVNPNLANNRFGTISVDAIDVQTRYTGQWSWHFVSINTGTAHNMQILTSDESTFVVVVNLNWGRTWDDLSSDKNNCDI